VTRRPPICVRRFLSKADEDLQLANLVLKTSTDHAAKFAYMAAYHAAQAALLDFTGDSPKTHKGMRNAFSKLASETEGLGGGLGRFLARSYSYKEKADYELEIPIEADEAREVIAGAADLLAKVKSVLAAR
jgi:uncharacterized protein (UPF0332 family)